VDTERTGPTQALPRWVHEVHSSIRATAETLAAYGVATPELLSELGPEKSTRGCWGQAELSWPGLKAGLVLESARDEFDLSAAESAGWKLFVHDNAFRVDVLVHFLKAGR
jgi:hypothetical protein